MAQVIDMVIKYAGFGIAGGLSSMAYDFVMNTTGVQTSGNVPGWLSPYVPGSASDYTQSFMRGVAVGVVIPLVAEPIGIVRMSPGSLIRQAQNII